MKIPISAAKQIAEKYDYDQIIIIGRKVGRNEHCTTYGVNKEHCDIAARCGDFLKFKVMGWHKNKVIEFDSSERRNHKK